MFLPTTSVDMAEAWVARSGSLRVAWVSIRGEAMEQVLQQEVLSLLLEVVEVVVELPGE